MNRKQNRVRALKRQVVRLDTRLADLARAGNWLSWARLGTFAVGAVASVVLFVVFDWRVGMPAVVLWLAAFNTVARLHLRVQHSLTRHQIWRDIKLAHIARMQVDWAQLPPAAILSPRPDHPFEIDLDLIGERALHRLIDTSISREGSQRLRGWLAAPVPDVPGALARQALVRELVPLTTFRDGLHLYARLASQGVRRRWDGGRVFAWIDYHTPTESLIPLLWLLTPLAAANAILFVLHAAGAFPPVWIVTFLAYMGLYLRKVQLLGDPFDLALSLNDPLNDLQEVLRFLETYPYGQNERLKTLCAPLLEGERRPSAQLRRVTRVLAAASLRRNPLLWVVVSVVVPWDIFVAHWLNCSREAVAVLLPQWLDVWFELEALGSLANFAYLNPAYTFPQIVEDQQPAAPIFKAADLGHPLIPDDERVCNDFTLDRLGDIVLVTGSNMSGKSTFLRTLGVNLCLAYAGGPVNARALRTVPFRLFTCIHVTDSVTDGISYFYAEVKRLKALLVALEQEHTFPLFFLIDEIFRGTNNRERMIGSRAYIRALVGRGGVGVISTHDLDLVKLADDLPPITNVHFAETILDGRMVFDYKLWPGPCPTTNALKIMHMEGLPVDPAMEAASES